jgi:hypothetical protein
MLQIYLATDYMVLITRYELIRVGALFDHFGYVKMIKFLMMRILLSYRLSTADPF